VTQLKNRGLGYVGGNQAFCWLVNLWSYEMSSRFSHSALWVSFLSLLVASGISNEARAWQFRDLDDVAPSTESLDRDVDSLLELIPTNQPFVAPTAAKPKDQVEIKEPVKTAQKPKSPEPPKVAPVVDKPKLTEIAVPKPEPIPMPELQKDEKPVTTPEVPTPDEESADAELLDEEAADEEQVVEGNPLDCFSKDDPQTTAHYASIETAKFNEIQPGISTHENLVEAWGESTEIIEHEDGSSTLVYEIPSFKQVDVSVDKTGIVSGIIIHLAKPITIEHVSKELGIGALQAVPIPDQYGEILGQAYPERGLLFSFTENIKAIRVSTILLEPVSAEMFRLRAQYDFKNNYTRSLSDLEQAIKIDPKDAEAYWMRSQYLDVMGKSRAAMASVQKAIRLQPTNPVYRLTRARLYAKTNRLLTGMEEVKEIIRELDLPPEINGQAHNLLGDMYAMGRRADHQLALKHHLKAIDHSVKAVSDRRFAVRRAAKHVLVNAHVSVARDIAMGNFQRQIQVVPKWLLRATEMADEFISDDQGDELLQMQIFRDTLASYAELKTGNFDAAIAVEEAMRTGREMIAEASDDAYKTQVERMLAESLFHAARINRARGQYDLAMKFANNALGLLDGSKDDWEHVAHDRYLEAQLYFVVGSIHAVRDSDHGEAVAWYAKARRLITSSTGHASPLYSNRAHGEMYVSMGLSYWEAQEQDDAMRLTVKGAEIMKEAVEDGTLLLKAMAVPYGNLATMHGTLGNSSKSQEFASLVAKIDKVDTKTR